MAGEPLKLIVGLGNPGIEYALTRHNAGFQFAEELARRHGAAFRSEPRHRAELARTRVGDTELWLLKPMSYMNHSGDPVRSVASFYKVPVESVLVAYDELDFPAGGVRLKQGGGGGARAPRKRSSSMRRCWRPQISCRCCLAKARRSP